MAWVAICNSLLILSKIAGKRKLPEDLVFLQIQSDVKALTQDVVPRTSTCSNHVRVCVQFDSLNMTREIALRLDRSAVTQQTFSMESDHGGSRLIFGVCGCCRHLMWFSPLRQDPLEAILVIFGCRALFFCSFESSWKK